MTRSLVIMIVCALAFAPTAVALADKPVADKPNAAVEAEAKKLFRSGELAFQAGLYGAAARAFEQAVELVPLPAIAFSAAQANRLQFFVDNDNSRLLRARNFYQGYLKSVDKGQRRGDAIRFLSEIEPMIARSGESLISAATKPTELMVTAEANAAIAMLDGNKAVALPLIAKVQPGKHTIQVSAEGYITRSVEAIAVDGRLVVVDAQLKPKPGNLHLEVESGTSISMDGGRWRDVPKGPLSIAGGRHTLALARRGRQPKTNEFDITNGQELHKKIEMESTGQRKLAGGLLITSGIGFIAAGGYAFLATRSQSDATKLSDESNSRALTRAELGRYNALIDERDFRMDVSYTTGALSGVLAITGLVLYYFDNAQPTIETPPLAVIPTLSSSGGGFALSSQF